MSHGVGVGARMFHEQIVRCRFPATLRASGFGSTCPYSIYFSRFSLKVIIPILMLYGPSSIYDMGTLVLKV